MSNPPGDGRFSYPTQEERRYSYAKLNAREVCIEVFEDFLCQRCPLFSLFYLKLKLWNTYFDKCKFTCYEKSIENNEYNGDQYAKYDSETGVRGHIHLV